MAEHTKGSTRKATARTKPKPDAHFLPTSTRPRRQLDEPVAIADMANLFGVTHRTLHFYEEKGMIHAGRIGLMRIYTRDDVALMSCINTCREIGMSVAAIQDLLAALANADDQQSADLIFENALLARRRELKTAQSTILKQIGNLEQLLSDQHLDDDELRGNTRHEHIDLNDMERRCLQLMAEGYAPLRLARALDMTSSEISTLETRIIEKLGANNRFQAVAKAVLLGIVSS
ncbi:MerR family transcriptional regulator [Agrobacterium sp. ES01]|uniref:MerR family transcriptional regulator n=1 Tax=Agrobacterium sp. ES01 TaxID=3420714 RepID=UPI003D0EFF1D